MMTRHYPPFEIEISLQFVFLQTCKIQSRTVLQSSACTIPPPEWSTQLTPPYSHTPLQYPTGTRHAVIRLLMNSI